MSGKFLGKAIKEFREKKNITQEELALKSDVSVSSISKIENGNNDNPLLETICNIAEGLEVSVLELYKLAEKIRKGEEGIHI